MNRVRVLTVPGLGYTKDEAVRTIVGEAADQGLRGMQMVAETIRARGSLKGCYGITADHINTEPAWVWRKAYLAWERSANTKWARGATGWGSKEDFKKKRWAKGKFIVARYKNQLFYKERI